MVKFPSEETGQLRKLSRPWHRITTINGSDVSVSKVYYPQDGGIQVHQSHVKPCPPNFPVGFVWYGGKRRGPGRPPKWVEQALNDTTLEETNENGNDSRALTPQGDLKATSKIM